MARPTVHCRIGSLEKIAESRAHPVWVHCRIGSLEIFMGEKKAANPCSLPHRQLRKSGEMVWRLRKCSLPHRQLRKFFYRSVG